MDHGALVVVLSSYNGSEFIAEQIESIRRQTFTGWRLLVRDDGSTDGTVGIIERLAQADPRIRLVRDEAGNLGPARSFGVLLGHASQTGSPYCALADQDDVWLSDKLERQLALLRRREQELGTATPLLLHSDLTVVNRELDVITPSLVASQGLPPGPGAALSKLLVQNVVTGCTVMINRSLLHAAVPLPAVVMHDWWLALCAAAMGEVLHLPESTVLYRQHGRNALGTRDRFQIRRGMLRRPWAWWRRSSALFAETVQQGCALAERVERQSSGRPFSYPSVAVLREFRAAFRESGGPLRRVLVVRRHGIRPRSLLPLSPLFYARVLLGVPRS